MVPSSHALTSGQDTENKWSPLSSASQPSSLLEQHQSLVASLLCPHAALPEWLCKARIRGGQHKKGTPAMLPSHAALPKWLCKAGIYQILVSQSGASLAQGGAGAVLAPPWKMNPGRLQPPLRHATYAFRRLKEDPAIEAIISITKEASLAQP